MTKQAIYMPNNPTRLTGISTCILPSTTTRSLDMIALGSSGAAETLGYRWSERADLNGVKATGMSDCVSQRYYLELHGTPPCGMCWVPDLAAIVVRPPYFLPSDSLRWFTRTCKSQRRHNDPQALEVYREHVDG